LAIRPRRLCEPDSPLARRFAYDGPVFEARAMTDTPDLPSMTPPSLPLEPPAGRPRIWQAALLFVAFGTVAGGSCVASESSNLLAVLFVLTMPFAAGALALLVFRLWRLRVAEAWPTLGQAALMAVAGAGLALGGCGGWAVTMDASGLVAFSFALGAVFVVGLVLAVGSSELFVIALGRAILKRPGAR